MMGKSFLNISSTIGMIEPSSASATTEWDACALRKIVAHAECNGAHAPLQSVTLWLGAQSDCGTGIPS